MLLRHFTIIWRDEILTDCQAIRRQHFVAQLAEAALDPALRPHTALSCRTAHSRTS